jgi:hypothetical protein
MMVDQTYEYNGPPGLIAQVDRNGAPVRHHEPIMQNGLGIIAQVDRNGDLVRQRDLFPQNSAVSKAIQNYDNEQPALTHAPAPLSGLERNDSFQVNFPAKPISVRRIPNSLQSEGNSLILIIIT